MANSFIWVFKDKREQAKVWGPLLPGLPCVCPQSPKTTCPPHTHRPLGTPHGSHTTGATSRGASSLVSSRLGGWTEPLFKALRVKEGLLWFSQKGWDALLNATADATGGGRGGGHHAGSQRGKLETHSKKPAWSQGEVTHTRERRGWRVGGGSSAVPASRPAQKQPITCTTCHPPRLSPEL